MNRKKEKKREKKIKKSKKKRFKMKIKHSPLSEIQFQGWSKESTLYKYHLKRKVRIKRKGPLKDLNIIWIDNKDQEGGRSRVWKWSERIRDSAHKLFGNWTRTVGLKAQYSAVKSITWKPIGGDIK